MKPAASSRSIHGLIRAPRKKILDERGGVFKVLAQTDAEFRSFGEVYLSQVKPGVVKAWKLHHRMTLNLYVVTGQIRFAFYDERPESPTHGVVEEIVVDSRSESGTLLVVPPGVWSGFQGMGETDSILINCASIPHDPDESSRCDASDAKIPYQWNS